jgi:hypothetical protein
MGFARYAPEEFVEDRYGPAERLRRQAARENVWWRRHLRWIAKWPVPPRIVIVLFEVTLAYTLLIFGLTLGVALRAILW